MNLDRFKDEKSQNIDELLFFNNLNISKLELSEAVRDKFYLIDVSTKMVGENIPSGDFCVFPDQRKDHYVSCHLYFYHCYFDHEVPAPVFVWSRWGSEDNVYLMVQCDEDFKISYPIEKVTTINSHNKFVTVINSEDELLEILDEIFKDI